MRALRYLTFSSLILFTPLTLHAQSPEIYVGPQIGLLGFGASAEVSFGVASLSAEFGYIPIGSISFDEDDIEYSVDPDFFGGLLMVNVGPPSSRFAVSGGLLFGGYGATGGSKDLVGVVEIGNNEYDSDDIGELTAEIDFGGIAPAVMVGFRGGGFNVGLGVAFTGSPKLDLGATGPARNNAQFQLDLDLELDEVQDEVDVVPILPLFRIGWQFGLSS